MIAFLITKDALNETISALTTSLKLGQVFIEESEVPQKYIEIYCIPPL